MFILSFHQLLLPCLVRPLYLLAQAEVRICSKYELFPFSTMQVRLQLAGSLAQEAFLQLRLAQLKGKQPSFPMAEDETFLKETKRKRGRRGQVEGTIEEGYPSLKLDQPHPIYQAVEHHHQPMMMHYDPQQQHQMMLMHHGTHFGVMPHIPQALHHPQL
jgi:hypothetical protein